MLKIVTWRHQVYPDVGHFSVGSSVVIVLRNILCLTSGTFGYAWRTSTSSAWSAHQNDPKVYVTSHALCTTQWMRRHKFWDNSVCWFRPIGVSKFDEVSCTLSVLCSVFEHIMCTVAMFHEASLVTTDKWLTQPPVLPVFLPEGGDGCDYQSPPGFF